MAEPTKNWNAGEQVNAADLNQNFTEALNDYRDFTLGETIAVNLPIYLKASDSKIYKTSSAADDEKIHSFVGFLKEAGVLNDIKKVQVSGKVVDLSGLTAGSKVYLTDTAGTYSHTVGTYEKLIGIAISTTSILLRTAPEGMLTLKAQAVTGIKTFGSIPVLPASDPTTDNQATRKLYVVNTITNTVNFAAGNILLTSTDGEGNTTQTSPTKVRDTQVNKGGTFRISFRLKHSVGTTTAYGQIYRDGSPVGTLRSNATTEYQTFSEDISGWSPGNSIQLYCYQAILSGAAYYENFRIYVDKKEDVTVIM